MIVSYFNCVPQQLIRELELARQPGNCVCVRECYYYDYYSLSQSIDTARGERN